MSNRTGLSTNEVEIDKRFSDLETLIETKLDANPESGTPAQRAQATTLPQVTGIRTNNQIVGAISFEWNAVDISNLLHYEVQVSSVENFTNNTTKQYKIAGQTFIILSDIPPTEAKFVRVRAVTSNGSGHWSSTLNTETGKATPNQLVVGAASNIIRHVQTQFDPPVLTTAGGVQLAEYGFIDIETIGGIVIIFSTIEYYLDWYAGLKMTISLLEDGNEILSFTNYQINFPTEALYSSLLVQSQAILTFPGMAIPSSPPAGVHTYSWQILLEDEPSEYVIAHVGAGMYYQEFRPLKITTALVELRR